MENNVVPGMKVECRRRAPWTSEITGIVEKVYENSVCIRISATSLEDDFLVVEKKGRTIVPIKLCRAIGEKGTLKSANKHKNLWKEFAIPKQKSTKKREK